MSITPGTRLGPYEVIASLGAGGMGEVYRALDTRLNREIAIKVLPAEVASDTSRLKRFEKEARSASALNHPNIVTIYDIGQTDSVSYIAMERVEGKTLRELLFAGALPIKRLLAIGTQIAAGLAGAHEAGIVHRDLKPENVMVTKDGLVKILDFGLAKLTRTDAANSDESYLATETGTRPGVVLGTVGYMSPEQAGGQPIDFRSDQFSFGSMLYEMATGKRAFQKGSAIDTLSAILHEDPKPVAEINPQAPLPFRWLVERCLAKGPEDRYGTTKDLARDLANFRDHLSEATVLGGVQVSPQRSRARARFWKMAALPALLVTLAGVYLLGERTGRSRHASVPSFHRLTFRRGEMGNARFAPDGQTIVYSATWEGAERQIYSTRLDSPESRALGFGRSEIVAISSAGEMAIQLLNGKDTLARVPMAGGVPREILDGLPWVSADWSPDGKNLVVVRSVERKNRLEFPIGKVLVETRAALWNPRLSPRGDLIAFFEGSSIAVIGSSGRDKKVFTLEPFGVTAVGGGVPCWMPGGDEIWFTAGEPERPSALYAVNLSGKRRLVTRVPGELELHDISHDGRVLMSRHNLLSMLIGVAPGEENERDLSWLDRSSLSDLSDDGRTLVLTEFSEGGGPNGSIYLRKTDGSPAVRLGEGHALSLSPDGKSVLASIPSVPGMPPRLVLVPTGVGEPQTLEYKPFEHIGRASWFSDGKRILFAGNEAGHQSRLYIQEIARGNPRPVTPEGVGLGVGESSGHSISPDGKQVIGVSGEKRERLLYPLEGGSPRPIRGLELGEFPIQWSTDGRELYVFRPGTPIKVWLLDLETGRRRLWKEIHKSNPGFDSAIKIRVTPDGRSYAYSWNRNLSELYLVDGLK